MTDLLASRLVSLLDSIRILPRRMLLETPGVEATVPMLRGVWGAALHDLDPRAYAEVFAPNDEPARGPGGPPPGPAPPLGHGEALSAARPAGSAGPPPPVRGGTAAAGYVLRPAPPDPHFAPAVEWILIAAALDHEFALCRAWDVASGMGLGPQRRRFHIRRIVALGPDGATAEQMAPWPLGSARWPASPRGESDVPPGLVSRQPCRLSFPAPLRLMRQGRLIERPTLADLVAAACRRVKTYLAPPRRELWDALSREALDLARSTPAGPWQGERLDLRRYSGRQRAELELRGVTGFLDLPRGPGQLWPLLAAALWIHLGKGTVMGLGQVSIIPLA